MRGFVITTVLVVVFASCETQELELVPVENTVDDARDGGAGGRRRPDGSTGEPSSGGALGTGGDESGGWQGAGGGPPSGSGGDRGDGGKGGGARPPGGDGGNNGAGGGPWFSGGFTGVGGALGPCGPPCPFGRHCSAALGICVDCTETAHCGQGLTCDTQLFRCSPFCESSDNCSGATPVCHEIRHICVECAEASDCAEKYRLRGACGQLFGVCTGCMNGACEARGEKCLGVSCSCKDDSGCEENERCNVGRRECVPKQN